jgi:acyl-CoA thioester hydrolase
MDAEEHSLMDEAGAIAFAPFVSSIMRVEPGWIDYNGHVNVAFYSLLVDRALDEALSVFGLGPDYAHKANRSIFVVESRISYRQELSVDDPVRATLQMIGVDDKRLHYYIELRHAQEGWVSATCEQLALHVDLELRRAAMLPPEIRRNLEGLVSVHSALPRPERLGEGIALPVKRAVN